MVRYIVLSFLICFIIVPAIAQDSTQVANDTEAVSVVVLPKKEAKKKKKVQLLDNEEFVPSPKKAAMLSAIVPGLGQAYNKKYWKIPIIYAGLATTGYFAAWNNKRLIRANRVLNNWPTNDDGSPNTALSDTIITSVPGYVINSYDEARGIRDFHRRNKDYSIILMVLFYGANVVDAAVDAHLYEFKITKEAIMTWEPTIIPERDGQFFRGLNLTLTF